MTLRFDHGTPERFKRDCRCDRCTVAVTAYFRARLPAGMTFTFTADGRVVLDITEHCANGYSQGCRCDVCRYARDVYVKDLALRKLDPNYKRRPPARHASHGTAYMYRTGCRCAPCTGANTEKQRTRRQT